VYLELCKKGYMRLCVFGISIAFWKSVHIWNNLGLSNFFFFGVFNIVV
jgi:hypothetical protein